MGACECARVGVFFNFSEGGWRHADNDQGGCLWMSKSGGICHFLEGGWRHADNVQGGGCLWMSWPPLQEILYPRLDSTLVLYTIGFLFFFCFQESFIERESFTTRHWAIAHLDVSGDRIYKCARMASLNKWSYSSIIGLMTWPPWAVTWRSDVMCSWGSVHVATKDLHTYIGFQSWERCSMKTPAPDRWSMASWRDNMYGPTRDLNNDYVAIISQYQPH